MAPPVYCVIFGVRHIGYILFVDCFFFLLFFSSFIRSLIYWLLAWMMWFAHILNRIAVECLTIGKFEMLLLPSFDSMRCDRTEESVCFIFELVVQFGRFVNGVRLIFGWIGKWLIIYWLRSIISDQFEEEEEERNPFAWE